LFVSHTSFTQNFANVLATAYTKKQRYVVALVVNVGRLLWSGLQPNQGLPTRSAPRHFTSFLSSLFSLSLFSRVVAGVLLFAPVLGLKVDRKTSDIQHCVSMACSK
jgi:hypothetical protein